MIVENKSEEKAIQTAFDAVRTAHANFLSMPAAIYFQHLNEAIDRKRSCRERVSSPV